MNCLVWSAIVNHKGSRNMEFILNYKHCHILLEDRELMSAYLKVCAIDW